MDLSWERYKFPIVILILVTLIVVVISLQYISRNPVVSRTPYPTPANQPAETPAGLGSEIYRNVQNPAEKIPDTNPFDKTNPFPNAYKNPF